MTVRSEIDRLTQEGAVYRLHGRGTFVAEPRVAQAYTLSSFTEDMRARGMEPRSTVRAVEVVDAGPALASQLEIPAATPVVRVERVRFADDEPMAVEQVFLPVARFPDIADADWGGGSLFELLAARGVQLRDADQRVVAVPIEGDDAA